jgi:hypothetical protein
MPRGLEQPSVLLVIPGTNPLERVNTRRLHVRLKPADRQSSEPGRREAQSAGVCPGCVSGSYAHGASASERSIAFSAPITANGTIVKLATSATAR